METIFEDPSFAEAFSRDASSPPKVLSALWLDVLDWFRDADGDCQMVSRTVTLTELTQLPVPLLRIIFAPLDLPNKAPPEILSLFNHYAMPSAFLAGRLRSVTHSFGALSDIEGYNCAWFHYLCKNVTLSRESGNVKIYDPVPGQNVLPLAQGDSSWIRSGYFLRWWNDHNSDPDVTLICFESPLQLKLRLQSLQASSVHTGIARDPYSLFAIVFEQLADQMDATVWDLMDVFRSIELDILATSKPTTSFTGLHNVAKHILFLQESAEAVMLTLRKVVYHHDKIYEAMAICQSTRQSSIKMTQEVLSHIETQFQCIDLRLKGLEKRMQNMIALSFHLVTQSDSSSMESISFMTLIFLPLSVVSTIFGSQFFDFDSSMLKVSHGFWVFWVISIPLTLIVLFFWHVSLRRGRLYETWKMKWNEWLER